MPAESAGNRRDQSAELLDGFLIVLGHQVPDSAGPEFFAVVHAVEPGQGQLLIFRGFFQLPRVLKGHGQSGVGPAEIRVLLDGPLVLLDGLRPFSLFDRFLGPGIGVHRFERRCRERLDGKLAGRFVAFAAKLFTERQGQGCSGIHHIGFFGNLFFPLGDHRGTHRIDGFDFDPIVTRPSVFDRPFDEDGDAFTAADELAEFCVELPPEFGSSWPAFFRASSRLYMLMNGASSRPEDQCLFHGAVEDGLAGAVLEVCDENGDRFRSGLCRRPSRLKDETPENSKDDEHGQSGRRNRLPSSREDPALARNLVPDFPDFGREFA